MSKYGVTNPAFINDGSDKTNKKKGSLELAEKGDGKYIAAIKDPTLDYNPYENRQVEHPTTNSDTLFHLLKGSLGTGILAMPNAFKNAGYIPGSIGTIIIGIICTYCIHQLIKAEYELCRRKKVPSMSYTAVAEAAMLEGPLPFRNCASYIGHLVNAFLLIYQLGTCCVYVVFVSSNIKSIADYFLNEPIDVRVCMLIILLPLILINWLRNLKYLAPFSTLANAITLVSFGIICYYIFREPISVEGKEAFAPLHGFPLFFGTVLFALEAIGVILPLENEMKTPKHFGGSFGVLNISMVLIVFLYVGMGLFGYLNYGDDIKGSITLNLPSEDVLAQCVKGMLAFAIFITHGLACYVAIDITWNEYVAEMLGPQRRKLFWEYIVRTGLVLITCEKIKEQTTEVGGNEEGVKKNDDTKKGEKSEDDKLDDEFNEYTKKFEKVMASYRFREKTLATEWLTKLKNIKEPIDEKKLRNRFIKHFVDGCDDPCTIGGVFVKPPFKTLPRNFKDQLIKLKHLLPKSADEALNPTEEEKLTYISDLFANLPDKGKFLASQPVPRDGSFFILVSVNTCAP